MQLADGRSAAELSAVTTDNLYLRKASVPREDIVMSGTRVGLVLRVERTPETHGTKTHSFGRPSEFCTRAYRFSIIPERLTKFRSGFAAVAHLAGETDLAKRLCIPQQHFEKYLAAVEAGRTSGDPAKWIDRKISTQPELCELIGDCHGVLSSLP